MSDMPDVIYIINDSREYEIVWSDSAFPYGDKKYISAEKAKADKLALLDTAYLEFCDTGSGSVEQFIRLLKQRIEAE